MSDPPDIESLARRYLDLWQQNISAAATDPDTARALAQFFGHFKGFGVTPEESAPSRDAEIADALASIDRRLAAIEARLDSLERPKRKPAAKPRSARSAKAKK